MHVLVVVTVHGGYVRRMSLTWQHTIGEGAPLWLYVDPTLVVAGKAPINTDRSVWLLSNLYFSATIFYFPFSKQNPK